MHRFSRRALVVVALLSALVGCGKCSEKKPHEVHAVAPAPLLPKDEPPLPAPWIFKKDHGPPDVALPAKCRLRAPLVRSKVAATTRFVAERGSLGALAVGEILEERVTKSGWMTLDPDGAAKGSVFVAWVPGGGVPRIARDANGAMIEAIDRPSATGSRVALVRGEAAEAIAEGDGFESVDIACASKTCALLTSRLGRVAMTGATVWVGDATSPASAWKAIDIVPASSESDASPLALADVADSERPGSATVATLIDKGDAAFVDVTSGAPKEIARVHAEFGALDAIAWQGETIVLEMGNAIDDDGCAKGESVSTSKLFVAKADAAPSVFRLSAPPLGGSLRRLSKGAIATWLTPLSCAAERRVVFGVVLDEKGVPIGEPMPIGDAASYAIASRGDDVDLWVQNGETVDWMRMTCAP